MKYYRYLVVGCSMLLAALGALNCAVADDDPQIGEKPLSELLKQLRSENRGLQMRAAQALSAAPTNLHARIMPQVMPVLKSERENDKFVAAQVLGVYGPIARSAVPDLLPMLKGTQYERNRAAASKALGQILKDAKSDKEIDEVTAALIEAFSDQYPDVRREAVTACGMIGPAAKACIPKLAPLLNESQGAPCGQSVAAAFTCERMGPLAKEHVDLLISILSRGWPWYLTPNYVKALGAIGPVQDNIAPNLLNFMEGGQAWSMVETWQTMQKVGLKAADQVIPFVKRFMVTFRAPNSGGGPPSENTQMCGIEAMRFLQAAGPKAADVLPEIEGLLKYKPVYGDLMPSLRQEAAKTADILKGLAAGNAEKAAPAAESKK